MQHITMVFKEPTTEQVERLMKEENWCAVSRDHALDDKGMLEDFIRRVADGDSPDPEHDANELMQRMGWR